MTPDGPNHHPLCWGAEPVGTGTDVRFRLWAPDSGTVRLRIAGHDRPLEKEADGWHSLTLGDIRAGTPYCYVLGDGSVVPDPASRAQQGDVHGPSLVIDPNAYDWHDTNWHTRPWEETVHYELHVGTFTPEGTFRAAAERLVHLADLGFTTIELMPVGQFIGRRGWGYDGALIYAPHNAYGTPQDLKALVDAAHAHGLNVLLDVIYNHFGPAGNYLPAYATGFFHPERHTPWGAAIAYEKPPVRRYFIDNALYWLIEYHFDGLRFDAVDHIVDELSETEFIIDLARSIRAALPDRSVHLTTEDNRNITRLHERDAAGRPLLHTGEWNDDYHNVVHMIATGETEGYYADFAENHWFKLARCLAEGFAFQGEASPCDDGRPRGEPSGHLPPTAFVDFNQNHDQVGNRAFGERLVTLARRDMVETLTAMLLLSPHIPLLFMGEEWGETRPFVFFGDYPPDLAEPIREGRRREFARFSAFRNDAASLRDVPDPNAPTTFEACKLDWSRRESEEGRQWMELTRRLLNLRAQRIVPLLAGAGGNSGRIERAEDGVVSVSWRLGGRTLTMTANLGTEARPAPVPAGALVYASTGAAEAVAENGALPACSIVISVSG